MPSGVSPIVLQGLRWWAEGAVSDQLAVELLARSFGGRYLRPGVAWVCAFTIFGTPPPETSVSVRYGVIRVV